MSNLQTFYFKLNFQKVDQDTGGKWLIHGTKNHTYKSNSRPQNSPASIVNSLSWRGELLCPTGLAELDWLWYSSEVRYFSHKIGP